LTDMFDGFNVRIVHDGFHTSIMDRIRLLQAHFILEEALSMSFAYLL